MTILKRRNLLLIFLSVILVGGVAIYSSSDSSENKSLTEERLVDLRANYPVNYNTLMNVAMIEVPFSHMLEFSQTAVVAEVIEKLPEYTINLIPDENTPEGILNKKHEEMGFSFAEARFTPFKVKVDEIIAGDPLSEYVNIYYNSDFINTEPDLAPGTKIVVTLFKAPGHPEGNYSFSKFGTYFVVDNDYVLSAYESKELGEMSFEGKTMNGKTLENLKGEIRDFKNN